MPKLKWNHYYKMGERCEHCGQQTIVYRREITFPMLYCMRILYARLGNKPSNYTQISPIHRVTTDFTKLRYWNFISNLPETSLYQVTPRGIMFMRSEISIRKYRWIYNDNVLPDPAGEINPEIFHNEVKPKTIDKGSILAESMTLSHYIQHQQNQIPPQRELFVG